MMLETIELTERMLGELRNRLRAGGAVLSYGEQRNLCALSGSLALMGELGSSVDRLSPLLGVDCRENPWKVELVRLGAELGVRARLRGGKVPPRVPEGVASLLHPLSLDAAGRLVQLVLFPAVLADRFRARGLELVVVRDWILKCVLAASAAEGVNYFKANSWELETNIAATQLSLLQARQIPFFGTHDLVDHLIGATAAGFSAREALFQRIGECFARSFPEGQPAGRQRLVLSYALAIVLDDMAQPRWYESADHDLLAHLLIGRLERCPAGDQRPEGVPVEFEELGVLLRAGDPEFAKKAAALLDRIEATGRRLSGAQGVA